MKKLFTFSLMTLVLMGTARAQSYGNSDLVVSIRSMCASVETAASGQQMQNLFNITSALMKPSMQESMKHCMGCHGAQGFLPFPGLDAFVKSPPNDPQVPDEFVNFLNSNSSNYNMRYVDLIQYKLGVHNSNPYGGNMPPMPWADNAKYASDNGIDPLNVQNIRRKHLAMYLTFVGGSKNGQNHLKSLCDKLNDNTIMKEAGGSGNSATKNTGASGQ